MKTRRHHNNTGYRQIKRGKTRGQVEMMARRLGLKIRIGDKTRFASSTPLKKEGV